MTEFCDIPEPVQWHEGMLLAPQHFQQSWLRSEALLGHALGEAGLFPWGVRRLSIDRALLAGGRLRLLVVEALLPDGLAVLHPREGDPFLELDLAPLKGELAQAAMTVHLTAPREHPRPEPGETRRWRSVEGAPVADANTGEGEVAMPRLRPALGLAVTPGPLTPPSRRFVSLPLARIGFRDDAFTLEPYAPPRTDFPAGSELAVLTASVAQRLRERAAALADRLLAAPGAEPPGGGPLDALKAMVGGLPRLEALLLAERVHPFLVYLALCDLSGALAWLGGQPVPPPPPPYHHDDPLPAFATLVHFLLRMVERVREGYRVHRFRRVGDNRFALTLEAGMIGAGGLVIGARAGAGTPVAEMHAWLAEALIGSRAAMPAISQRRLRGAARARIDAAEELGLVPPPGMALIRISPDPEFVLPDQPFELAGSGNEPAELLLYTADAPGGPAAGTA